MADNITHPVPNGTVQRTIDADGVQIASMVLVDANGDVIATLPVSVASLPLPTGAATSENQQTDALTDTELRATPVPVSGTVAATGPLTDAQLRDTPVPVDGSGATQPISAAALPLPAGAATAANQQNDALTDTQLRATPVPVSAASLPLPTGAATAANQQTDALTDAELRATPVPVSAASLPLPTGAATAANQQTDALTNDELRATPVPVSGTVTATPSGTQTIEGTVTANLGTIAGVATESTVAGLLTDAQLANRLENTNLSAEVTGTVQTVPAVPDGQTPQAPVTVLHTASGNQEVIEAPGAGNFIRVFQGSVIVNSTDTTAGLRSGTGTIVFGVDSTDDQPGGATFDFGPEGFACAEDEPLNVNLSGAGSVRVNVTDWVIEAV